MKKEFKSLVGLHTWILDGKSENQRFIFDDEPGPFVI
jgi:hypothetical protein